MPLVPGRLQKLGLSTLVELGFQSQRRADVLRSFWKGLPSGYVKIALEHGTLSSLIYRT